MVATRTAAMSGSESLQHASLRLLATVMLVILCSTSCGGTPSPLELECSTGQLHAGDRCLSGTTFHTKVSPVGGEQLVGGRITLFVPQGAVDTDTFIDLTMYESARARPFCARCAVRPFCYRLWPPRYNLPETAHSSNSYLSRTPSWHTPGCPCPRQPQFY